MQTFTFQKPCRLAKLSDELVAAIPALAPVVDSSGLPNAVFQLWGDATSTTVVVPDAVTQASVAAVVTAHDASTPSAFEQLQATSATNKASLTQKSQTALSANQTFLALASPTNAQVLAQVQMLTRECSAVIRLLIGALDTTTGT